MADDMEGVVKAAPPKERIHYGSIEEQERARLAGNEAVGGGIAAGIQRGNINIMPKAVPASSLQASEGMQQAVRAQQDLVDELERKKKARALHLPTDDAKVKGKLRQLGEPICLFAEDAHDRRERLRAIISRMSDAQKARFLETAKDAHDDSSDEENDEFFTEGSQELKRARLALISYSFPRAQKRVAAQKIEAAAPLGEVLQRRKITETYLKFGDERPITYASFSPDGQVAVTGSLRGNMRLWGIPNFVQQRMWTGHNARIGSVVFHPQSRLSLSPSAANVLSCDGDGQIKFWSLDSNDAVGELVGHKLRVSRAVYHPSGRYVGSASYDTSWRLWDVETQKELVLQEGHAKEVYGIAFHPDGSLAATCGLDSHGLIWDIRSGRRILDLEGHVKPVYAIDFSPNGYEVVTGGEDNSLRIWDLRAKKCRHNLPAHTNLISSVKFEPQNGTYVISGAFDNSLRSFLGPDWRHTKTLIGHENKITSVDISPDGKYFMSSSIDRTVKLWVHE